MPTGKAAAQAGHAFLNSFLEASKLNPKLVQDYQSDGLGTKLCLNVPNLDKLLQIYDQAIEAGLPCALIEDSGHVMPPHFDGNPIITALGIGPVTRSQHHAFTRRLALL